MGTGQRPVVIDLCCGLGGWTRGFLAEGWDAIGFDIEEHQYGAFNEKRYPGHLILADILTLNGYDLRSANPSLDCGLPTLHGVQLYGDAVQPGEANRAGSAW